MELTERRKKRAANMVWTAAGQYDLEPPYLFYLAEGEPALYLNTLEGLAYHCLEPELILPLLEGLEVGKEPDKYRTLVLLILESAVFQRQAEKRPSLAGLRREYAETHLSEMHGPERYQELGRERQEILHYRRVLGQDTACFTHQELLIADELEAAARMEDAALVPQAKQVLWRYYFYRFTPARHSETTDFIGAGILITLISRLFSAQVHSSAEINQIRLESSGSGSRLQTFLKHILSQTTQAEDRSFIEHTFGPCLLPEQQLASQEKLCCTGYHTRCHLWYTGAMAADTELSGIIRQQIQRNRAAWLAGQRAYRRGIHAITEQLKHALEQQQEPDLVYTQSGRLDASHVYRIRAMHDLAVFHRELSWPEPDFTVNLVLDASNSRSRDQEAIAIQAYMIAQSLLNLEVPVQVISYRSMRGYTILQQLKSYETSDTAEGIFQFYAIGNNRDGLALTALRPFLQQSPTGRRSHIVLVLTDALPSDTKQAYVPGTLRKGKDYDGALAVEDTRAAVRQLQREGIHTAAIFWGKRYAAANLKQIYGDSYISIQSISQFPNAVIGLLLRILDHLRDAEQ